MITEKPTYIYIPGLANTTKLFERQLTELNEKYHVKTIYLPSHADKYDTFEKMADYVYSKINTDKKIILHGESFGGVVALYFTLKYKDRVSKLILQSTAPYFDSWIKHLLPLLRIIPISIGMRLFIHQMLNKNEFNAVKHMIPGFKPPDKKEDYHFRLRMGKRFDYRNRLNEINIPVLVIGGKEDKLVDFNKFQTALAEIKNSKLVALNGGHISNFTNYKEFNKELIEFLNK